MGLIRIHGVKMRIFSLQNSSFLLLTKLGSFEFPSFVFNREYSFVPSFNPAMLSWPADSKNSHFLIPKRQTALFHSSIPLDIEFKDSNGKHKYREKRNNYKSDGLPIYVIPALTSFFFYSSNAKSSHYIEGRDLIYSTGVYCLPKTEQKPKRGNICSPLGCGEDSYCVSETDEELVLAVADGVGGWRKQGVDPAIFSQTLMYHADKISKKLGDKFKLDSNAPRTLIHDAFWGLVGDFTAGKKKPFGSSTACVVMINKITGEIKFGNLGDSGFIVLSPLDSSEGLGTKYRIKFKSESQQHRFNMPYQITLAPPNGRVSDTSGLTATNESKNPPTNLIVESGDIVLLMTDGVLDNIFDDELEDLVSTSVTINSKKHSPSEVPRLIAQDIAFKARYFSEDSRRESPFSVEARKHGLSYLGGKEDDITVIASVIYNKKQ